MRAAFLILFLSLPAAAGAAPLRDPVTYLGSHILSRTDLVVRGRIESRVRLPVGTVLSNLTVAETLLGEAGAARILLLSLDPSALPPRGTEAVFFLRRVGEGRYEPLGSVDTSSREGSLRLATLRKYLAIERIPDATKKREELRDLLLANLASKTRFLFWSAARELAHFSKDNRAVFRPEDVARIRKKLAAAPDPLVREFLKTTLENLGAAAAPPSPGGKRPDRPRLTTREFQELMRTWKAGIPDTRRRLEVLKRLVSRYLRDTLPILPAALRDSSAPVREVAALSLGEGLVEESVPSLVGLLAGEKDLAVRKAAIQALGILRARAALPVLEELGRDARLLRTVAFAVARIGGPRARGWLAGLKAAHPGAAPRDREIRRLVDFLLSEDFRKQEAAMAEIRRKRLR